MSERAGEARVAVRLLGPAFRYLERLAIDRAQILAAVGLDPAILDDPDHLVADVHFDGILAESARVSGDPLFGLHAGEYLRPGDYGLLEVLIGQTQVNEDMTDLVNRFHGLLGSPGRPPLVHRDDGVTFISTNPDIVINRHAAEYSMVNGLTMARLILRRHDIVDVAEFMHTAPADTSEHARVFGGELRFEQNRNALTFPILTMPTADRAIDKSLSDWLMTEATQRLARLQGESTAADRVREVLHAASGEGFHERSVAYQLAVSARTLRRQLAAEDTSFAAVRDEVREAEARRLLTTTDQPIVDIAVHLGFADASGFHRAFKRLTGLTPTAFRGAGP